MALYLNRENNTFAFHCLASSSLASYWRASRERLLLRTSGRQAGEALLGSVRGQAFEQRVEHLDTEELVVWLGPGQDALQLHHP